MTKRYLWGQAVDQLLAQETVDDGGPEDVSYIVRDNLGSTRSLVSHLGGVTATYSYDSYGNVTATVGSLTATRFLYTCQEYDTRLGLHYYNARWYSPTLGRFISEDPMGFAAGDANLYRYVGNNSTTYADPSGLCEESGGAASDLLFRVGETPVTAANGSLTFSDYSGLVMARMLNFGSDMVFHPGETPVTADNGSLNFSDYVGVDLMRAPMERSLAIELAPDLIGHALDEIYNHFVEKAGEAGLRKATHEWIIREYVAEEIAKSPRAPNREYIQDGSFEVKTPRTLARAIGIEDAIEHAIKEGNELAAGLSTSKVKVTFKVRCTVRWWKLPSGDIRYLVYWWGDLTMTPPGVTTSRLLAVESGGTA